MSRVVHLVARAGVDDPHTLGVLALAAALGADAPVLALDGAVWVDGVEPIAELPTADVSVAYHLDGAAPRLVRRLIERAGPTVVVDGGAPLDPLARRDLSALAAAGAAAVATSAGDVARLLELGFRHATRVPPLVARDRIRAVPAFAPTAHHLDVAVPGPLVVCLDDLATPVNAARVAQAYHVLRTYLLRAANLVVGVLGTPATDETAVQKVCREIWGLRLTDAWTQRVAAAGERAALTRAAAVVVTTAPAAGDVRGALAAMAEGVPAIVTADASAAEVLRDGALVLPADAPATLIAEAMVEVLTNDDCRARLAARAGAVVAGYEPARIASQWRAVLS